MFIPNKTFHAIRAITLSVIASMGVLIAGGSLLYVKMEQQNEKQLAVLQMRLDSLMQHTKQLKTTSLQLNANVYSNTRSLNDASSVITTMTNDISNLESSVNMLIRNECKVMPFYMDEKLVAICKQ